MELAAALPILARAASQLAGAKASQFLRSRSRRRRVARVAARESGAAGSHVSSRSLYRWLQRDDTLQILEMHTEASLAAAARSLSWMLPGDNPERQLDSAVELLWIVLRAYVRDLDVSVAIQLTSEWQQALIGKEAAKTREVVEESHERIMRRFDAADRFDEQLTHLPPGVDEDLHELRKTWRGVETLVDELASSAKPGETIGQWSTTPPAWMAGAPTTAFVVLGDIAASYGEQRAARAFFLQATDNGAAPRAYLLARAAQAAEHLEDRPDSSELLAEAGLGHPLSTAMLAIADNRLEEASGALQKWSPGGSTQKYLKGSLLGALARARGDLGEAIRLFEDASNATGTAGGLVAAAELLLSRASGGSTANRLGDAQRALDLAVRARNLRRSWKGDSAGPAGLAVIAAVLVGDPQRAWRLTKPHPEGEATEDEATNPEIRTHSALTAALTGRFAEARESVPELAREVDRLRVAAILVEQGEIVDVRYSSEKDAWRAVWSAAESVSEKLQAARALAEHGEVPQGLEVLALEYPDAVDEIRVIAAAMAPGDDQRARLRAGATTNLGLAVSLAEHLTAAGELEAAGAALEEGGERWAHPRLLAMAAVQYRQSGNLESALRAAGRGLALADPSWPGIRDLLILLVELRSEAGDWSGAVAEARKLVAMDATDDDARWALVRCLYASRDLELAWSALVDAGRAVRPRSRDEAIVWIDLFGRYAPSDEVLPTALAVLDAWKNDEQVFAAFLQVILLGRGREMEASAEQQEAVRAAIQNFTDAFPESEYFRAIPVDESDPLASLAPLLQQTSERLSDVAARVRGGELPIGFLAAVSGRSLTEASLRRVAGGVLAHLPGNARRFPVESLASEKVAVIDPTAAHTLALLSSATSELLVGSVPPLRTTTDLFTDALSARDALLQESTLAVGWNASTGEPSVSEISEADARLLAERAAKVVGYLGRVRRSDHHDLKHFRELNARREMAWLSGLDLAIELGCPYWSDDAVLRQLAEQMGVSVFSTVDLLELGQSLPGLSSELAAVELATLLRNYYVDLPFAADVWRLAATEDAWMPRGVAFSLTRAAPWRNSETTAFVLEALEQSLGSPEAFRDWIGCAAMGVGRMAGADESGASRNMLLLAGQVLAQRWMGQQQVPFLLGGLRVATAELGVTDVVPSLVRVLYRSLTSLSDHATAAGYLRTLFALVNDDDQRLVARTVLTQE